MQILEILTHIQPGDWLVIGLAVTASVLCWLKLRPETDGEDR